MIAAKDADEAVASAEADKDAAATRDPKARADTLKLVAQNNILTRNGYCYRGSIRGKYLTSARTMTPCTKLAQLKSRINPFKKIVKIADTHSASPL